MVVQLSPQQLRVLIVSFGYDVSVMISWLYLNSLVSFLETQVSLNNYVHLGGRILWGSNILWKPQEFLQATERQL